jgi:hypothetical protein
MSTARTFANNKTTMTITYKIDENDFLAHQLYTASKSERINKKRQRNKLVLPIIYVATGLLFFLNDRYPSSIIFLMIGLLWFFIYPVWDKQRYVKHYKSFIQENYKERLGITASMELSNDFIFVKSNASEGKVLTTEINEIAEISSTIFIRLKGGQTLILPKDKIADIDNVKSRLKELAGYLNIKYDFDKNWEWK